MEAVFGKCLPSQLIILAREWLELLESRTSVVTNHDITQLGHPLIHQIWCLWDYFQKSNSTLKEKMLLSPRWFPKTLSQVLGRLMCETCWDRMRRKGGSSGWAERSAHQGPVWSVGSVQQAPKMGGPGSRALPQPHPANGLGRQWFHLTPLAKEAWPYKNLSLQTWATHTESNSLWLLQPWCKSQLSNLPAM